MATLLSNKIHFKAKIVTRDKEGHFIIIKESLHQEYKTIINIHSLNNRAPKYRKQKLTGLKEEIDNSTIIKEKETLLTPSFKASVTLIPKPDKKS